MSYIDEKKKLMHRKKEILEKYKIFFSEVMVLGKDINKLENEVNHPCQEIDIFQFYTNDSEMQKIFRLMSALMYVEKPNDKEIVESLRENIKINFKKSK